MKTPHLQIPSEELKAFCRKHHIQKLSFFGSVLDDNFKPQSDIDVLVEFAPGHTPGWEIVDIEEELSRLLGGRKIDMANPKYINRRIKERVLAEAKVQYAER